MKIRTATLLLFHLAAITSSAELIGRDAFDYPDGPLTGTAGGTAWDLDHTTATATHTATRSDWDAPAGTPTVTSGTLTTADATALRQFNGPSEGDTDGSDERLGALPPTGTLYLKTTMSRSPGTTASGISIYHYSTEKIFFGIPGNPAAEFGIQVTNTPGSEGTTESSTAAADSLTYTLVAKIDFEADLLSLYIDPDLSAPEPGSPTVTRPYSGTPNTTAVALSSRGAGTATWDELAVATTWQELALPPITGTAVVTNTNDSGEGSLRDTINRAEPGTTLTFHPDLAGQTIRLTSARPLVIDKPLTIDASALATPVTISGDANGNGIADDSDTRVIGILDTDNVAIKQLIVTHGSSIDGAGIDNGSSTLHLDHVTIKNCRSRRGSGIFNSGTLVMDDCIVTGNSAIAAPPVPPGDGGGIFNGGSLVLNRCSIENNSAQQSGGGIYNTGSLRITATTLSDNTAAYLGGIWTTPPSRIVIENSVLSNNANGAILNGGKLTISGSTVSNNPGLGITAEKRSETVISTSTISGNTPGDNFPGGGISNGGHMLIMTSTVSANSSTHQGGGLSNSGTMNVEDSSILDNSADLSGGGIHLSRGGSLSITRSVISENRNGAVYSAGSLTIDQTTLSDNTGSAISIEPSPVATISNSTITGNAPGNSRTGGIDNNGGEVYILNSTITGNGAAERGGGIRNSGTLSLDYTTIVANSAPLSGGGIFNDGTSLTITNSIVTANTAPGSPDIDGPSTRTNSITSGDPRLAPLGDYGGPTATMPPLPGSPAIDNAIPVPQITTDQRGLPRPIGIAPDIGAAEYLSSKPADLWPLDLDHDGSPYGTETALGTDPLTPDAGSPKNLTRPTINSEGHAVLTFGRNPDAVPGTTWSIYRSTDLVSFQQIFAFDGTTPTHAPGITSDISPTNVTITDTTPPPSPVFYQFRATLSP